VRRHNYQVDVVFQAEGGNRLLDTNGSVSHLLDNAHSGEMRRAELAQVCVKACQQFVDILG
jgi:hypothetical protein